MQKVTSSVWIGGQFPYPELRGRNTREPAEPVLWQWKTLAEEIAAAEHTEYGTLTLSTPDGGHEVLPGTSMTFQVVRPGGRTTPHAHSWWHLYFVRSGLGSLVFTELGDTAELTAGDIVLIPAWVMHRFDNNGAADDLVLLNMSNLPQQAGLGNLLSRQGTPADVNTEENWEKTC